MKVERETRAWRITLESTFIYLVLSVLWIIVTDRLLAWFVTDPVLNLNLQTYKGWFFVLISSCYIFIILWKEQKAQESLSSSEQKFHGLFDSMVEGVALHEMIFGESGKAVNYRLIDVNPSFEKQTGIKIKDAVGRLATETYGTNVPPFFDEYIDVVKTGEPYSFQKYFSSLKKIFRISAISLGENRFATIFEDVTKSSTIIKKLRESEEKFSKIFMNSPQIITISSLKEAVFLDVNEAFTDILGYKREEVIGESAYKKHFWVNEKDRKGIINDLKNKKNIRNREYVFRTKKGSLITCLCSMTTIKIGGVDYLLILAVNIEDRKIAEKELERLNARILEEKQNFESVLQEMGDAVMATDSKGKVVLVNKEMVRMSEVSVKSISGKNIKDSISWKYEKTGTIPVDLIEGTLNSRKIMKSKGAIVLMKKNGTKIYVDVVGAPIVRNGGELVGSVWILHDVTKEKELEKMRTDFISLASHQLRTPLTGIRWFVELLNKNVTKMSLENVQGYIQKIGESSERMNELVNDLLTTSRADEGRLEKLVADCSVKDLMKLAIEAQGRLFLERKIQISGLEKIPKELKAEVDKVQMSQVFSNLVNNAINYSPNGGAVEVGAESLGGKVKIWVRDHGLGIPEAQHKRVFEKFFRADNVAKTIPGSGLGLYVAKSMVKNHGGNIWFESKEKEGTTFFVELPIKQKNGKKESDDR